MARPINKEKNKIRKADILAKSSEILSRKGYEFTSVSDIVEYIGIGKGTFYHYFKSKEEIIDKLIEYISNKRQKNINYIKNDVNLTDLEKFNKIFDIMYDFNILNFELKKSILKILLSNENLIATQKYKNSVYNQFSEDLVELLKKLRPESEIICNDYENIVKIVIKLNNDIIFTAYSTNCSNEDFSKIELNSNTYKKVVSSMLHLSSDKITFFNLEKLSKIL